jgi:NADH pyrophosphatase NudC (nudix superfamily)
MHPNGGELRPSNEVDDARWVSWDEAERMLSYERDLDILRSATR